MTTPLRIYSAAIWLAIFPALTGCTGYKRATNKNFLSALNYYFSHNDDCLFASSLRFPYEASTTASEPDPHKAGLDALAAAGLLRSLEDRDIHVKRYEKTPFGNRVTPRFCYGHRVVAAIDSSTPPVAANGQQTTEVSYHYKMMAVPGWADTNQIRKAFPQFAQETSDNAQAKTTLVLTVNGWRVPE